MAKRATSRGAFTLVEHQGRFFPYYADNTILWQIIILPYIKRWQTPALPTIPK